MGLKAKLSFLFTGVGIVFSLVVAMVFLTVSELEHDGHVINVAGRQRMLSQKMTKEAYSLKDPALYEKSAAALKETSTLFKLSLKGLKDGDPDLGLPIEEDLEVRKKLDQISTIWVSFEGSLEKILSKQVSENERAAAYAEITKKNIPLLKESNEAVKLYEKRNAGKVNRLRMVLWGSLVLLFGSLAAGRVFVTQILSKVMKATEKMTVNTEESIGISREIADLSYKVSDGANEEAAAIQESVSTLDEINALVSRGLEYSNKTRDLSRISCKDASEGKAYVEEMVHAVEEISNSNVVVKKEIDKSNERISEVVVVIGEISEKTKVINDIVFQTKLLSFNASVEAARAGEHGKGFAVVAEEVGNLAQMSGAAAKEIEEMLNSSISKVNGIVDETKKSVTQLMSEGQGKIDNGVKSANRCVETLNDLFKNVEAVDEMMKSIATAAKEQAEGIQNISVAMNQLNEVSQKNSAVADSTAHHTSELLEKAENSKVILEEVNESLIGVSSNSSKNQVLDNGKSNSDNARLGERLRRAS